MVLKFFHEYVTFKTCSRIFKFYKNVYTCRPLPEELCRYAQEDTHYLLYIYDCLKNELSEGTIKPTCCCLYCSDPRSSVSRSVRTQPQRQTAIVQCHIPSHNYILKDGMSSLIWTYGDNHYFLIYTFPSLFLSKRKMKIRL